MGTPLRNCPLDIVRARIASAWLASGAAEPHVGSVTLFPEQAATTRRAADALAQFGGVLIADDVGSGKTFVALALARAYANPVAIVPASLRATWRSAMTRAELSFPIISIESLSRGRAPPAGHDLVIVDEAHRLRNPRTRAHRSVRASITPESRMHAHVALLSATPLHNVRDDVHALLSLFLRADAPDLDDETRSRVVVRGAQRPAVPDVRHHRLGGVREAAAVVRAIGALPAPVASSDGGDAAQLVRLSYLRAWCSSAGALEAMARRAQLRTAALVDALRVGHHPTTRELGAWMGVDGQLAFPEFTAPAKLDHQALLAAAVRHLEALAVLRALAAQHAVADDDRVALLRRLTEQHAGVGVLACTQYAATVVSLWRRLRTTAGVAMLTSNGAHIASGPIPRQAALERFAPAAQGVRAPHARERISLLVATDLVSEGLNLHDAGVVVHLDIPWTAARLAQRVGRVARVGSPHDRVDAYTIVPPHAAATLLRLERRCRAKGLLAAREIGGAQLTPLLGTDATRDESPASARARIDRMLRPFQRSEPTDIGASAACISAPTSGWLALVGPAPARLVARIGRRPATSDPRIVATAVERLVAVESASLAGAVAAAERDVARWISRERGRRLSGASRRSAARAHGRALASTVAAVALAPPHERARAAHDARSAMDPIMRPPGPQFDSILALVVFCCDDGTTHGPAL